MSLMDLVWVAVGFILGVAGDFAISLWLSYSQFLHSTANYRLEKTVEATKEIIEPENLSRSRDRYRYSLGVIIDHLSLYFAPSQLNRAKFIQLWGVKRPCGA